MRSSKRDAAGVFGRSQELFEQVVAGWRTPANAASSTTYGGRTVTHWHDQVTPEEPHPIDLDIQKFFDSVPWDLVVKAVRAHTEDPWVVLYVKRWLQAPVQQSDGTMLVRDRGTPGSGGPGHFSPGLPQ